MREGKPVKIRRGSFDTWYATRGEKSGPNGLVTVDTRFPVENGAELDQMIRDLMAEAWDEGFKQGGPMHDVNHDDPDAHTRNPYRNTEETP